MAPAHDSNTYVEHGKRVFEKIDVNKSGSVNLEQFIDCCIKVSAAQLNSSRHDV